MRRAGVVVWVTILLALLLVLPELAVATEANHDDLVTSEVSEGKPENADAEGHGDGEEDGHEEEDEDDLEEFEEDDEVSLAVSFSKSKNKAVKALPLVTDQNADRILNTTEYLLLMGYAPWCKQSAKVMIDFAEAATVLTAKANPTVLAKVDAIANKETAKQLSVKGYPTILFITNGSSEIYSGGQTRDEFVNWVQKRTGQPAATFTTTDEAKEHLKKEDTTSVIGFFEEFEGPEYEEFIAASKEAFDVEFLQTTNVEAAQVFSGDFNTKAPAIAIWKSAPEKFLKYGGPLVQGEIFGFVELTKFPLVAKLHARNSRKVYESVVNKQVILFANNYDYDSIYPFYLAAAKYFKGQLFFLWVDMEDEDFAKPMTTMYGILGDEARVAGFDNNNGTKYLLDAEVTRQSLKAFVINYKEGRLKPHFKSEPIPKKNKGDVKIIVGKTFGKLVLNSSKGVILLVSTTYCYECDKGNASFAKAAKHFKPQGSIIFARIDATHNDHPMLKVQNYPAVLSYQAGNLGNSPPVEFPNKPTFKKLVKFVEEEHLGMRSTPEEETEMEANSADTESGSIPGEVESESPVGTEGTGEPQVSLVHQEVEELQGSPGTVTDEVTADEELEDDVTPTKSVAVEPQGSGVDPLLATSESSMETGLEEEIAPNLVGVNVDVENLLEVVEESNRASGSHVQHDPETMDVLPEMDITSNPTVTSLEVPEPADTEDEGTAADVKVDMHFSAEIEWSSEAGEAVEDGVVEKESTAVEQSDAERGSEPHFSGHEEAKGSQSTEFFSDVHDEL